MRDRSYLDWPFFDDRAPRASRASSTRGRSEHVRARRTAHDVDAACRALVARARRRPAGCAMPSPARRYGGAAERSTRARSAWRARRWRATTASPTSRSPCRGSARARSRLAARRRRSARYLPRVARGEAIAAFALSEPEAGSDVAAMALRRAHRRRRMGARRREDLDLERRHRRLLCRVRAHRRGARRARHLGLHRRRRHAGLRRSPSAST